jgi:glycosyltransferase involved in cell wall biosynthesis
MRSDVPRVSVGLPVYNGEDFLEQAIESILCQTFEDFELIISDNASDDATEKICRTFAERDRRIRYHRNSVNIGGTPNFNRLVRLARADYFKWAAHDDLCAPDFLGECVAVLDREATVVLCHSVTQVVDSQGHVVRQYTPSPRIGSPDPRERFSAVISPYSWMSLSPFQFGIIRIQALRNANLLGVYPGSDKVLLAQLALAGRLYQVPELLFSVRSHPNRYNSAHPARLSMSERRVAAGRLRRWLEFHDPGAKRIVAFPNWKILAETVRVVLKSDLPWSYRINCWMALARSTWWCPSDLVMDLDVGFYALSQRLIRVVKRAAQT